MHKDAHGAKEMQLELSQQLFSCDDMKVFFDKYRIIGDGICGIKMSKQNMRERNWRDQKKPQQDEQKPLKKLWLNSSYEAEEKSLYEKQTKSTK